MTYISNKEIVDQVVPAMRQWLISQNIDQSDWGPIFAKAAGLEVARVVEKIDGAEAKAFNRSFCLELLKQFLILAASGETSA